LNLCIRKYDLENELGLAPSYFNQLLNYKYSAFSLEVFPDKAALHYSKHFFHNIPQTMEIPTESFLYDSSTTLRKRYRDCCKLTVSVLQFTTSSETHTLFVLLFQRHDGEWGLPGQPLKESDDTILQIASHQWSHATQLAEPLTGDQFTSRSSINFNNDSILAAHFGLIINNDISPAPEPGRLWMEKVKSPVGSDLWKLGDGFRDYSWFTEEQVRTCEHIESGLKAHLRNAFLMETKLV
jgi:hypothetical protein